MRGRMPAALVIFIGAILPPLLPVSGGALSLVTLRRGAADGLFAGGVSALVLIVLGVTLAGTPAPALRPILQLWLPVFLIAVWLRYSVSLAQALELSAGLALIAVVLFHLQHPETAAYWQEVLGQIPALLAGPSGQNTGAWQGVVAAVAPGMTRLWAVTLLGLVIVSLFLGRWWQAILYNPGGFRAEFHALRLERWFAWVALAWLVAAAVLGSALVYDIAFVLSSVFVLQSLAVLHAFLAQQRWAWLWLVPVYMFLLFPLVIQLIAIAGIIDAFLDVRRRSTGSPGPGGSV